MEEKKKHPFLFIIIIALFFAGGFYFGNQFMNFESIPKNKEEILDEPTNETPIKPKPEIKENSNFAGERTKTILLNDEEHELLFYFYGEYKYICCDSTNEEKELNSYKVELYLDNIYITEYTSMGYGNMEEAIGNIEKRFNDKTNGDSYIAYLFNDNYYIINENGKLLLTVGISSSEDKKLSIPFTDEQDNIIELNETIYNLFIGDNYIYTYITEYSEETNELTLTTYKYQIINGKVEETKINTYTSNSCGNDTISVAGEC